MDQNIPVPKQQSQRNFKVSVFGEARSGKSLLIDFMKNEQVATGQHDRVFSSDRGPEGDPDDSY